MIRDLNYQILVGLSRAAAALRNLQRLDEHDTVRKGAADVDPNLILAHAAPPIDVSGAPPVVVIMH